VLHRVGSERRSDRQKRDEQGEQERLGEGERDVPEWEVNGMSALTTVLIIQTRNRSSK
jgi:hypothetical protein